MTTTTHDTELVHAALEPSPLYQGWTRFERYTGRFFAPITWRAFAYHVLMLCAAIVGFTYSVVTVSLGLSLAILVVGLPLTGIMLLGARVVGTTVRTMTNGLLGTRIKPPLPFDRGRGFGGFVKAGLSDTAGWRAIAFLFISLVTSIFTFTVSITFFAAGLGAVTYFYWYGYLPLQEASDGSLHRGAQFMSNYFIDTPGRIALQFVIGLVLLVWVWPAVNNASAKLHAVLAAALLGPTEGSIERHHVLLNRARSAEAGAQRMRAIERDLHDVTQAQLVSIAMKLGDAKERLAAGESPEAVLGTLDSAHLISKDALTDLRGLVQGIHPAALNDGLGTALSTLASTSALRVRLELALSDEISPAVELVAYYAIAELLTNSAKHSGAAEAQVKAWMDVDRLYATVTDHGMGGARLLGRASLHGTGLDGVAERVQSVGGSFDLNSPVGGPTTATLILPRTLKVDE